MASFNFMVVSSCLKSSGGGKLDVAGSNSSTRTTLREIKKSPPARFRQAGRRPSQGDLRPLTYQVIGAKMRAPKSLARCTKLSESRTSKPTEVVLLTIDLKPRLMPTRLFRISERIVSAPRPTHEGL